MIAAANICECMAVEAQAERIAYELLADIDRALARAAAPRLALVPDEPELFESHGHWFARYPGGAVCGCVIVEVCAEAVGTVTWAAWEYGSEIKHKKLRAGPEVSYLDALLTWDDEAYAEAWHKLHPHELPDAREAAMDRAWDAGKENALGR